MDWNSPTTKKHITEAKAQGCELIGSGRNAQYRTYRLSCGHEQEVTTSEIRKGNFRCQICVYNRRQAEAKAQGCKLINSGRTPSYRIYLLPCGHKQEIHISQMSSGGFRCRTCLDKSYIQEAKKRGSELLGPGSTRHHRLYRLVCGHEQLVTLHNMRKGDFSCRTCIDNRLKEEAESQDCKLLGAGRNASNRLYMLPCGHEVDIGTRHMRTGNFRCQNCFNERLTLEAAAQGSILLGPGSSAHHRTYRLQCGHEQQIRVVKMRHGRFQCQICLDLKWAEEAQAYDCKLLGPAKDSRYRTYRLPCGHKKEISTGGMRIGAFLCNICFESKIVEEASSQGCVLLGPGKDNNSRNYRLSCGHEQSVRLENIRNGIFRCNTCLDEKIQSEARAQGCQVLGSAKHTAYRTYRLPCGHVQEVQVTHIRNGSFSCQVCEDWAFTQPSQAYLLHIKVGPDEWLKLGFAKNVDFRVSQYGLPSDAVVSILKTKPFDTGKEAQAFEKSLHEKHQRKRLKAAEMADFHSKSGQTECYPVIMVDRLMAGFADITPNKTRFLNTTGKL